MSSGSFSQQPQVQAVLANCRRQIRKNVLLSGIATVAVVVIAGILLAAFLDYVFPLPTGVRLTALILLASTTALVAYRQIVRPLRDRLSDQQLGAAVDLSSPEMQESLATLISIEDPSATASEAGSHVMRRHLQSHVAAQVTYSATSDVVDLSTTRRRCGMAGLAICVAMIPLVLWPSISTSLINRLVSPFANLATVSNLYFEVPDGNRTVARGSDVVIKAVPAWRNPASTELPEHVSLKVVSAEGMSDSFPMQYDDSQKAYMGIMSSISQSVDYQITSSDVVSETFRIDVVDRPTVLTAVMVDTPPVYTGRAVQRFDGMVGEMEVFEGSQLQIDLSFNKPVESVVLKWLNREAPPVSEDPIAEVGIDELTGEEQILDMDPDAELPPEMLDVETLPTEIQASVSADGLTAQLNLTADVGGAFEFVVLDQHEISSMPTTSRELKVLYDLPPELKVGGLREGDRFRPDDIVPLNCIAADDLGLGIVELHYQLNDQAAKIVPAADFEPGSRIVQTGFRVPLEDLQVEDGDVVRVKVKAVDERPEPRPQTTWSDVFSVTIDSNASAAGADAMDQETDDMIRALKQLESMLREDEQKGWQLRNEVKNEFNDERKEETRRLSEKEQQQGQILEQLAEQVATHPLMQDSAEKLKGLSNNLREEIPELLDDATDQVRTEASKTVEEATKKIQATRNDLNREIRNIEQKARLEQELAELNRLALEAEQLASDSEQLQEDRASEEARPEELTDEEWQEQLRNRQEELQQEQQDLSQDIEQLLEQQQELRTAAQNAQKQQLMELADEVQKLAQQQSEVAQGAQEEAREAGRDARQIANELEKVRQEATALNKKLDGLKSEASKADTDALQKASTELRRGNLDDSRQNVADVAQQAEQIQQELQQAAADSANPDAADPSPPDQGAQPASEQDGKQNGDQGESNGEKSDNAKLEQQQQATNQAASIQQKLNELQQEIQKLQAQRNTAASQDQDQTAQNATPPSATDSQPADANAGDADPKQASNSDPASQVQDLMQAVQDAADAAQALSEATDQDQRSSGNSRRAARDAAQRSQKGAEKASAGRFSDSAKEVSRAAAAAQSAASQLNNEAQQEQQQNAQALSQRLGQLAENLQSLQQDDASQIAAQQQTQAEVAEEAAALPERVQDLQEKLELPSLQMQDQAQKAAEATDAAGKAADTSQQASEQLQQGNLQQAGQDGRDTAEELRRLANAARQAGQQGGQQQTDVPNEVGESVADALQQLQEAARAMEQQSNQPGQQGEPSQDGEAGQQGEPGQEGQPGQTPGDTETSGESGSPSDQQSDAGQPSENPNGSPSENSPSGQQSLSDAANSLAEAARQALPSQHRPGDPANTNSQAASDSGNGSSALWNGLLPRRSIAGGAGRNWGQLNDELDTDTSEAAGISRDSEYEALIRMYFREVAKSAKKQP